MAFLRGRGGRIERDAQRRKRRICVGPRWPSRWRARSYRSEILRDEGFFAIHVEQCAQLGDFSESRSFQHAGFADEQQRFGWVSLLQTYVRRSNVWQFFLQPYGAE
jgi:hypothetical protein